MEFRIADTFTDSLARLAGDEQKSVKTTAFDLQLNPANPGMSFHKLAKAKDKRFWSVRVGSDLRLIVHRSSPAPRSTSSWITALAPHARWRAHVVRYGHPALTSMRAGARPAPAPPAPRARGPGPP